MELPERTKDITVGWLNQVFRENGLLGNANIVSLKHEQIGEGRSFASDSARLTLSYSGDAPHLPKTIVAKLPPSTGRGRETVNGYNVFESELRFYEELAPKSPIITPKLVFGGRDAGRDRWVLLLEDCSHATAVHNFHGLNYEQTEAIVSKIADFHAYWWDVSRLYSFTWMPGFKITASAAVDRYRASWDRCAKMEDFRLAISEASWEAGLKIYERLPFLVGHMPEEKLTVIHDDLCANNVFFVGNNTGVGVIFFDWSNIRIGRGPTDLSYLLGFSLPIELRRKAERDLVKLYHERLVANGAPDYSFGECWKDYLTGLVLKTWTRLASASSTDVDEQTHTARLNIMLPRWFSAIVDNEATSVLP